MKQNIRDLVLNAINTDISFTESSSFNIKKIYTNSNNTEKQVIDNIFINLCGYSLSTILQTASEVDSSHHDKVSLNSNIRSDKLKNFDTITNQQPSMHDL